MNTVQISILTHLLIFTFFLYAMRARGVATFRFITILVVLFGMLLQIAQADEPVLSGSGSFTGDASYTVDPPIVTPSADGTLPGQGETDFGTPSPPATPALTEQQQLAIDQKNAAYDRKLNLCANVGAVGIALDGFTTAYAFSLGGSELNIASPVLSNLDVIGDTISKETYTDHLTGEVKPIVSGKDRTWACIGIAAATLTPAGPWRWGGVFLNKVIQGVRMRKRMLRERAQHPEWGAILSFGAPLFNSYQIVRYLGSLK